MILLLFIILMMPGVVGAEIESDGIVICDYPNVSDDTKICSHGRHNVEAFQDLERKLMKYRASQEACLAKMREAMRRANGYVPNYQPSGARITAKLPPQEDKELAEYWRKVMQECVQ